MSSLNENQSTYSARLLENIRDIPFAIYEHVLKESNVLRPKQKEAINGVAKVTFEGNRAVAMIMPTGTGKTVMISQTLVGLIQDETAGHKPKKTIIVTDSKQGVLQTAHTLKKFAGIDAGLYYSKTKDATKQVTITTYNSWQRKNFPIDPKDVDIVILDEGHKSISEARLDRLKEHQNALWLPLTASPTYSEIRSLLSYFAVGFEMDVPDAVHNNLICSFRNILLNSNVAVNVDAIGINRQNDYNEKTLAKLINTEARNRIGAEYLLAGVHPDTGEPLRDIRGIVSCANIKHAKDFADQTNKLYKELYPDSDETFIAYVYGDQDDRDEILKRHQDGKIKYLAFSDLLIHNYDDPGIGICLNLRLTKSYVTGRQRGGRTQRLDPNNDHKIALIVDVLDNYEGEETNKPLFYASTIGHVSIIKDEDRIEALKLKAANNVKSTNRNSLHDRLRDLAQSVDMQITTDEETIFSIVSEFVQGNILEFSSARAKTENDLTTAEVASILKISITTVLKYFDQLAEDWDSYEADSKNVPRPEINLYKVKLTRIISAAIDVKDFDKFVLKYMPELVNRRERLNDDLDISQISNRLSISRVGVQQAFNKLSLTWEKYNEDNSNSVPIIPLHYIKAKSGPTIKVIKENDYFKFVKAYFPKVMNSTVKTDHDFSANEIAEKLGMKADTIIHTLAKLENHWNDYESDFTKFPKPLIKLNYVRTPDNRFIRSIHADEYQLFAETYFEKNIGISLKTSQDLSSQDIAKLSGMSSGAVTIRLNLLEEEWKNHNKGLNKENPPEIKTKTVKDVKESSSHVVSTIHESDYQKFYDKFLAGWVSLPEKTDSDLSVEDVAARSNISTSTIWNRFSKLTKEWEKHEADIDNVEVPMIAVKMVRMRVGKPTSTIDEKDYDKFIDLYFSKSIDLPSKTENDLTTEDIARFIGINYRTSLHHFTKLTNAWENYNSSQEERDKPNIPVKVVKNHKGVTVNTIHRDDLVDFFRIYSPKTFGKNTFQAFAAEWQNMRNTNSDDNITKQKLNNTLHID